MIGLGQSFTRRHPTKLQACERDLMNRRREREKNERTQIELNCLLSDSDEESKEFTTSGGLGFVFQRVPICLISLSLVHC